MVPNSTLLKSRKKVSGHLLDTPHVKGLRDLHGAKKPQQHGQAPMRKTSVHVVRGK